MCQTKHRYKTRISWIKIWLVINKNNLYAYAIITLGNKSQTSLVFLAYFSVPCKVVPTCKMFDSDRDSVTGSHSGGASGQFTEVYSADSYVTDPDYMQDAPSDLESSPPATDYESLDSFYKDEVDDDSWNPLANPFSDHRPHSVPEFTGIPGFNAGIDNLPNLTVSINMYLPDELLQYVVDWTNCRVECISQQIRTRQKSSRRKVATNRRARPA